MLAQNRKPNAASPILFAFLIRGEAGIIDAAAGRKQALEAGAHRKTSPAHFGAVESPPPALARRHGQADVSLALLPAQPAAPRLLEPISQDVDGSAMSARITADPSLFRC